MTEYISPKTTVIRIEPNAALLNESPSDFESPTLPGEEKKWDWDF